ncbi:tRNA (guanosine(46)-N7)-methyltransferase TrmB [Candidatus Nomurabacteria bacterium]|nr:tRNA (guanosine(46)-N7)-methyltransferase TrmB [Candidatus Nomurabacteria bacterium]
MPRKKLQRFTEIKNLDNVWEFDQENLKQRLEKTLENYQGLNLELACGKGEYTLALAEKNPRELFVGIDLQGERLWSGATTALKNNLNNVLFLRVEIEKLLDFIPEKSVKQIWLTFPDPQAKKGRAKKRLTAPRFLEIYQKILKAQANVHLKTDDQNLFLFSQASIKNFGAKILESEKYQAEEGSDNPLLAIKTTYEKKQIAGQTIYYLKFNL